MSTTTRKFRIWPFVLGQALIAFLILGGQVAYFQAKEESDKQEKIEDEKKDAENLLARQIASCNAYNEQQVLQIAAEEAAWLNYIEAVLEAQPQPVDPELQADADAFLAEQYALIEGAHPSRDCSPEGIAQYIKDHQEVQQ